MPSSTKLLELVQRYRRVSSRAGIVPIILPGTAIWKAIIKQLNEKPDEEFAVEIKTTKAVPEQKARAQDSSARRDLARLGYSGNSDFAEPVSNEIAECVVCCDEVGNKLACGHAWCTGCVSQSLKHACKDRGLFPPKCCNEHLDTEKLLARVGPALRQEYLVRKETYLKENEVSCSSCGTPIPANAIRRGLADCECGRVTCMFCKKARHDDPFSCVEDGGLRESLTSGGVRVCPGPCSSVIEKHPEGCYNVTCVKCPTTFCFRCGKTSCSCPGWPEVPTYDEWAKSQEKAGKKPDKTPMQDLWD